MRTLLVLVATIAATATARAEKVGVVVTGEPTLQPQVVSQLEGWLRDRGRIVIPGALEPSAINTLIDCFVLEDLGCARGVVDQRAKAKSVVFARVDTMPAEDGMRNVFITGTLFQKGHESITEKRACARCTEKSLHDTVDELMLALLHDPPAPLVAANRVVTAPATIESESSPRTRMLPLALMGVGGLGLVAGGILIAIDDDEPAPMGPQEPRYNDTMTGGIVLGIAGAAALGTGIYLYLRNGAHSAPVAAVGSDSAIVGWAGRF